MSNDDNNRQSTQRIEALYRSLPDEQPPDELSERIISAAHAALGPASVDQSRPERRWYALLSMAAVILVSFSVVLTLVVDEQALAPETHLRSPVLPHEDVSKESNVSAPFEARQSEHAAPQPEMKMELSEKSLNHISQGNSKTAASRREDGVIARRGEDIRQRGISVRPEHPYPSTPPVTEPENEIRVFGAQAPLNEPQLREDADIEQRVDRLHALLETQQFVKLQQEMQAFRRLYPDYPLPASLVRWEKRNTSSVEH